MNGSASNLPSIFEQLLTTTKYVQTNIDHIRRKDKAIQRGTKTSSKKSCCTFDIDTSLLAKYERNERQPSKELIKKIAL